MLEQFHLDSKRCSKRAVRLKTLDDVDVAENLANAARIVGKEAVYPELKKQEWSIGIKQFVVEVSEPCDDPLDPKVKWTKVNPASYDDENGGLSKYFTAKDVKILEALYREFHEVTQEELDTITGKGKAVAEG